MRTSAWREVETAVPRTKGNITRVGSDLVLAWTESKGEGDDGEGQQVHVATAAIPKR